MFWKVFEVLSVAWLGALAINLVIIFFLARIGGEVYVYTNKVGEAQLESFLFPTVLVMGAITLIRMLRRL